MDHDHIKHLQDHPTVRLFRLDHAPLIISFLFLYFKKQNRQIVQSSELITSLSDYLFGLRESYGKDIYAGTPQHYLDKWSNEGFLRKFYAANSDDPVFELTPATEKALDWINDLDKREFVGTESRLLKIFEILKEIVFKSSEDPQKRLDELERQKSDIEKEIEKIKAGDIEKMSETKIKERFFDMEDTARKLLSDFRQIEYNFRELDRSARERQITSTLKKGRLLEDIFKAQDLIWETDQGRSFRAFWEFLMSQAKQDELDELIDALIAMPELRDIRQDDFIERIKVNLVEGGDKVNKTTHQLIGQLRKYLDDKAFLENKRIIEIVAEIKALALSVKQNPPKEKGFLMIDDRPSIDFVMDRSLFNPPRNPVIKDTEFEEGIAENDTEALYRQLYIDPEELRERVREMLKRSSQVTLKQITEKWPVEKGLSEVVTYFSIASKDKKAVINDEVNEEISIMNRDNNDGYGINVPQVIFCR